MNEIDAFTKTKRVISKKERFVSKGSYMADIHFEVHGDERSLIIETYDRSIECYDTETKIMFRFKNGEVLTMTNELNLVKEVEQTIESSNGEIIEIQSAKNENCGNDKIFKSTLDENAFQLFKNQELEKIRVSNATDSFDYDVKLKYRFKISKQINCIESALKQL